MAAIFPRPDKFSPLTEVDGKSAAQSWFDFWGYLESQIKLFLRAGTQADQEAGTSNTVAVTPGTQQFHPSAAKGWVKFTVNTGVIGAQTINASYNVASVTRTGAGAYTVAFTIAFSSANYAALPNGNAGVSMAIQIANGSQAAGSIGIVFLNSTTGALVDPTNGFLVAFGDQ